MRLSVWVATVSLSIVGLAVADDVRAAMKKATNIPAEGLGVALQALAKDRNFQVVYVTEEVSYLRTQGAVGEFTADEALKQLLKGTGLTYRYLDERTVTITSVATAPASAASAPGSASSTTGTSQTEGKTSSSAGFRVASADAPANQGTGSLAASPSSALAAAKSPEVLEEVVVTAQKRQEKLLETPESVSVLSSAELAEIGAVQFRDFANTVPGLSFTTVGAGLPEPRAVIVRVAALLATLVAAGLLTPLFATWARSEASAADVAWRDLARLPQRWTAPIFQLKAADFIRRGIAAGPSLGAAMRSAKAAWIAADFPNDRATVEAIAEGAATEAAASS